MFRFCRRRAVVHAAVLVMSSGLMGCTSYRAQRIAPPSTAQVDPAARLRVTLRDGTQLSMVRARIAHDTLFGVVSSTNTARSDSVTALAIRDVQTVEARHLDTGRTIALVLGSAGAMVIALVAYVAAAINNTY